MKPNLNGNRRTGLVSTPKKESAERIQSIYMGPHRTLLLLLSAPTYYMSRFIQTVVLLLRTAYRNTNLQIILFVSNSSIMNCHWLTSSTGLSVEVMYTYTQSYAPHTRARRDALLKSIHTRSRTHSRTTEEHNYTTILLRPFSVPCLQITPARRPPDAPAIGARQTGTVRLKALVNGVDSTIVLPGK